MTHKCDGCRYKGEHQEQGFVPFGVCLKETNLVKAERNYNAECCPYIVDTYAEGTAEELQEVIEDLRGKSASEDFSTATEALQTVGQEVRKVLLPLVETLWELVKKISDAISYYPNKKVLRLALYHPKERVRKKNLRRITKWFKKTTPKQ